MIADPKAKQGVRYFYEQWMHLPDLPLSKTAPFKTLYTTALAASIKASFDLQMDDALWADKGAVTGAAHEPRRLRRRQPRAHHGRGGRHRRDDAKVQANPAQRAGIMTHPALMAIFATENESPPHQAWRLPVGQGPVRPLPDPPANVPPFVAPGPGVSVRTQFETLTADKVSCQPCHMAHQPRGLPLRGLRHDRPLPHD